MAACLGNTFKLRQLTLVSEHAAIQVRRNLSKASPSKALAEVRLHIGRVLLANMTADELAEHVFDVANQFNRGGGLLIECDEKVPVAALDLRAGRRAKASAAYAPVSRRWYDAAR